MGKVKEVKGLPGGTGTAEVTMEVKKTALPLHTNAEAKIRTRIFLEGNFFVDIKPGTPSAPILPEGEPIPKNQTYSLGAARGRAAGAEVRHPRRPAHPAHRVLAEGPGRGRGRGLQRHDRLHGARIQEHRGRQRRAARREPQARSPARAQGPAAGGRRAHGEPRRAPGAGHKRQHHRRRARAGGRLPGRLDPGAARPAQDRLAGPRVAERGAAVAAPLRRRGAARRALHAAPPSTPRCPSCVRPASCSPSPSCAA